MRRVVAILAVLLAACGADAIDEVPSRESASPTGFASMPLHCRR